MGIYAILGVIVALIGLVFAYLQYFHPRSSNEAKTKFENKNEQTVIVVAPSRESDPKSIVNFRVENDFKSRGSSKPSSGPEKFTEEEYIEFGAEVLKSSSPGDTFSISEQDI